VGNNNLLKKEVTVIDTSNYIKTYAEKTPFLAVLFKITDYPCFWVRSKATEKEYELYDYQIEELSNSKNLLL
jgi:hypothetical protein